MTESADTENATRTRPARPLSASLPAPSSEQGLTRYLAEIRRFPILERDEEYMLAKRWVEHQDPDAAHALVTSHLRLAAKIALGYRGYGLPPGEMVSEANVGLMQAVKRFDPDKGFRLSTYAMWWIRAAVQEYILRSWSLVKLGTTAAQKKLFFNLRRSKARIGAIEGGDLSAEATAQLAAELDVSEDDVVSMNRRLSGGDVSLNAPVGDSEEGGAQWQDWLEDDSPSHTEVFAETEEMAARRRLLDQALDGLTERERDIFRQRRLHDPVATLESLAQSYKISRERVRQIEMRAFKKVQERMRTTAEAEGMAIS